MRLSLLAAAIVVTAASTPDWSTLWQPDATTMPASKTIRIASKDLADLGADLENREWQMVATSRHQLYFQPSADRTTVSQLYARLDRVYEFLAGRSPTPPTTAIKVFLVPNERGHSRCSQLVTAMRTGEQGELPFLLTSVLHEETHLFNFATLGRTPQSWWCGEFTCVYFQQRALLEYQQHDLRQELGRKLPHGPVAPLAALDAHGQNALDDAAAAMYFLEATYGREKMIEFRRQCLMAAKAGRSGPWLEEVLQHVFGKGAATLDKEWRAFFGWQ